MSILQHQHILRTGRDGYKSSFLVPTTSTKPWYKSYRASTQREPASPKCHMSRSSYRGRHKCLVLKPTRNVLAPIRALQFIYLFKGRQIQDVLRHGLGHACAGGIDGSRGGGNGAVRNVRFGVAAKKCEPKRDRMTFEFPGIPWYSLGAK